MQPVHSPALATLSLCALAAVGIGAVAGPALFASAPRAVVVDDPILALWPNSLTTLEVAAATPVQDVRPLVGQRATNLDGMLRARPMQAGGRLALAAIRSRTSGALPASTRCGSTRAPTSSRTST